MTREEAIETLKNHTQYFIPVQDLGALNKAISALRPISREQVEKMKGEWKSYLNGDYNDEVYYCGVCGCELDGIGKTPNFCPECGCPMNEKAVEILWRELKEIQDAD